MFYKNLFKKCILRRFYFNFYCFVLNLSRICSKNIFYYNFYSFEIIYKLIYSNIKYSEYNLLKKIRKNKNGAEAT